MELSEPKENPGCTDGHACEQKPGTASDSIQASEYQREEEGWKQRTEERSQWMAAASVQKAGERGGEGEDIQLYGACALPARSAHSTVSMQASCHSDVTTADSASHAQLGEGKVLVFQYPEGYQRAVAKDHCYASPPAPSPGSVKAALWRDTNASTLERESKPAHRYNRVFTDTPDFHRLASYATPFPKLRPDERITRQAKRRSSSFQQWRDPAKTREQEVEEELVAEDDDAVVLPQEDTQVGKRPHVIPWEQALQSLEDRLHQEAARMALEKERQDMTGSLSHMELGFSESE